MLALSPCSFFNLFELLAEAEKELKSLDAHSKQRSDFIARDFASNGDVSRGMFCDQVFRGDL